MRFLEFSVWTLLIVQIVHKYEIVKPPMNYELDMTYTSVPQDSFHSC